MKIRLLLATGICALLFQPAVRTSAAADPIGSVVMIEGYATATSPEGKQRRLNLKAPVFLNDKIATGRSSKLQIVFDDDSMISQGEKSEMTIDEYVYSPGDRKKTSSSMKIAKGFFRVVTGKITALNPDRFKVQTRMASIGIRGCEVGFAVGEDSEEIYILWLPDGKSILVRTLQAPAENSGTGLAALRDAVNIIESGVAVSVRTGAGLQERPLAAQELGDFYEHFTENLQPLPDDEDGVPAEPDDRRGEDNVRLVPASVAGPELASTADGDGNASDSPEENGEIQSPATPEGRPSLSLRPPTTETPTAPPPASGPTEPPPGTTPGDLPPLPPEVIAQATGRDWLWGIWDDGTMDHHGQHIPDQTFQDIVAGSSLYDLVGTGSSGAYLRDEQGGRLVTGACNMSVKVGRGTATWSGVFNMSSSDGDMLQFDADGAIVTGGMLQSTLRGYSMKLHGVNYSITDLSAHMIQGAIVGSGGAAPVSGVEGNFSFAHGSLVRADGVYGSDLVAR